MRFRKINNIIHRDFGYFFAGTTIIYAISGIAVNHVNDWNPNFIIHRQPVEVEAPVERAEVNKPWVMSILGRLGEQDNYRSHDFPADGKLKIYLDDGSVFLNLASGVGEHESVTRRPILYEMNRLHLAPKHAWLIFSDIFAVGLIVITVSGLFVLKGKYGVTGRCLLLVIAGVLVPIGFLFTL